MSTTTGATEAQIDREWLGRLVRDAWVAYCHETGDTKPSHVAGWDSLSAWDKEADRRIGEAIARAVLPAARIAACHRVAAALQAILDYDRARNSPGGIHAAHFAAQKPLQALKSGDVETVLAMGRDR